jgi:hypothetical protein
MIGGSVRGLTAHGLVLQDKGADNLTLAANATTFTFGTPVTSRRGLRSDVMTPPANPAQDCMVNNGLGTVGTASISTVTVSCVNAGRFVFVVTSTDGANGNGDVSAFTINPNTGPIHVSHASAL